MKGDILVLVEHASGGIDPLSLQIIAKARELADTAGCRLKALLLRSTLEKPTQFLQASGADDVLVAQSPYLNLYNSELYIRVIEDAVRDNAPSLMLLGHTFMGMDVGPALATRMGIRLFSNCVDIELSPEGILVTRPMYGGMVYTQPHAVSEEPIIVSIQSGALPRRDLPDRSAELVPIEVEAPKAEMHIRALNILDETEGAVDLGRVDIIVAAGRGIGDKSNLRLIEALADALGGAVACSRPLVDCDWLPAYMQVGISGQTVRPKVYVACGISGASQHIAGMRDSQLIIAINNDPRAPIFRVAHYGIVGDLLQVIPALIERARELRIKHDEAS